MFEEIDGLDELSVDAITTEENSKPLLNAHGEYVLRFARNHGISIAETHEQPMVKAHLAFMSSNPNFLRPLT